MGVDIVTVSSRGQIVIPTDIMEELNIKKGEKLLVINKNDNILLKKIKSSIAEMSLEELLKPMWEKTEAKRLTEKDVDSAIRSVRKKRRRG
jgi:antitoxin PrlF